jgi:hypothetical protein
MLREVNHLLKLLETTLATHCAPVLFGRKPSALFAKPAWWDEVLDAAPGISGLRFFPLYRLGKKQLILAYSRRLLSKALKNPEAAETLKNIGYISADVESHLCRLALRFEQEAEFPHEVGFFLGYPPGDVLAFIRHRGDHCKLCGMWKVYGNVENALRVFAEYEGYKKTLLNYIGTGGAILGGGLPAAAAVQSAS